LVLIHVPERLVALRRLVAALRPGGWLLIELGGEQDRAVGPALAAVGFTSITTRADEDGDLRGLVARLG
ncbi:MAG TPA: hypothetical protein VF942_03730, partial [Acidimicrobiales bacterium]